MKSEYFDSLNLMTIKDKVLVAIGDMEGNDIACQCTDDIRRNLGETFSIYLTNKQISNAVRGLKQDGYVIDGDVGYLDLTPDGYSKYASIVKAFTDGCAKQEFAQPKILQDVEVTSDWASVAKSLAGIAQKFVDSANANAGSLQKMKEFEAALAEKDAEIERLNMQHCKLLMQVDSLKKSLAAALADIAEKNKKIDHLESGFDKIADAAVKMHGWISAMKNGAN